MTPLCALRENTANARHIYREQEHIRLNHHHENRTLCDYTYSLRTDNYQGYSFTVWGITGYASGFVF